MRTAAPMPQYQCHKKVWALKIKNVSIERSMDGKMTLEFEGGFAPMIMDNDFRQKNNPHAGGYFVRYEGGYESFSPAKAFEEGYSLVN